MYNLSIMNKQITNDKPWVYDKQKSFDLLLLQEKENKKKKRKVKRNIYIIGIKEQKCNNSSKQRVSGGKNPLHIIAFTL